MEALFFDKGSSCDGLSTSLFLLHQTPPLRDLWKCNLSSKPLDGYTSMLRGEYPVNEQVRLPVTTFTAWLICPQCLSQ